MTIRHYVSRLTARLEGPIPNTPHTRKLRIELRIEIRHIAVSAAALCCRCLLRCMSWVIQPNMLFGNGVPCVTILLYC